MARFRNVFAVAGAAGMAAVAASPAAADVFPSDPILEITATNGGQTGSLSFTLGQAAPIPNGWVFQTAGPPMPIMDGPDTVAFLNSASVFIIDEHRIGLNFNVTAGSAAVNFDIVSTFLQFFNRPVAEAAASAGITTTDQNGNGSTVSGLFANGSAYEAHYNGTIPGADGSVFASLLGTDIIAGNNSSATDTENVPVAPGFVPISGPVNNMSARFQFSLTAGDSAGGTSTFVVVPAPGIGAVALFGFAGIARRRR